MYNHWSFEWLQFELWKEQPLRRSKLNICDSMKHLSVLPPLNVLWLTKTDPQLSYLKPIHAAINIMGPYLFRNGETWATLLIHIASFNLIIFIAKPTRCTSVSNLFYFEMTLHVSDGLFVHHQEFKTVHTATGICQRDTAVCSLASRQQYLFDKCLLLYVQSWTPDDGRKDRPKYVECYSKIK